MRSKLRLATAIALVLGLAGFTVASASSGTSSSSNGKSVQVIHLVAKDVQQEFLDLGASGLSQGDQLVFTHDLFRAGHKFGDDGGACTVVRLRAGGAATFQCLGTNSFPGGDITVQGFFRVPENDEEPFRLAITGGTDHYRTAHGEVIGRTLSETELDLTFRIIR